MKEEIYIRVGGAAGQGGASTGETIAKNFARHGLNVCTQTSYQSAIRGGHNWIEIRASDKTFYSQGDGLDILIALNQHTVEIHGKKVRIFPQNVRRYQGILSQPPVVPGKCQVIRVK